ncbi:electron transfer flavoprotein subunit alpha/FixB family protein [Anaerovorax odorimutans]|uniref:Electron transfer flavoprotein subunit alpha/FixB family protein n=1 Tax=Anaerovorax odorimutans TaxID=109327 RepID=A0ABT1RPE9_9FIRM|nr:electron transfer flavoprotein subunit alpha/FixB family protein [Anaerovorax odorimutans]
MKKDEIICSGGRGFKRTEDLQLVKDLAQAVGGSVGASRGAVSMGWIDEQYQVGLTGRTVTPDIYFACGISGMNQHLAGMKEASVIVAINKNPKAAIFKAADYGIVGDVYEVLPQLIEKWGK